jgi:hypothetical protein
LRSDVLSESGTEPVTVAKVSQLSKCGSLGLEEMLSRGSV